MTFRRPLVVLGALLACGAPGLASAGGDLRPVSPAGEAPLTVGIVAPADPAVARDLADGATLACEEATRAGGSRRAWSCAPSRRRGAARDR
ncbi:MAG: hypothetical protein U1E39_12805 [Planctomycetota bacterium]